MRFNAAMAMTPKIPMALTREKALIFHNRVNNRERELAIQCVLTRSLSAVYQIRLNKYRAFSLINTYYIKDDQICLRNVNKSHENHGQTIIER